MRGDTILPCKWIKFQITEGWVRAAQRCAYSSGSAVCVFASCHRLYIGQKQKVREGKKKKKTQETWWWSDLSESYLWPQSHQTGTTHSRYKRHYIAVAIRHYKQHYLSYWEEDHQIHHKHNGALMCAACGMRNKVTATIETETSGRGNWTQATITGETGHWSSQESEGKCFMDCGRRRGIEQFWLNKSEIP